MPIEGIGTRFFAHGSQTRPPQERQLCLSLASCASLSEVLAQVKRLAQQQLCQNNQNEIAEQKKVSSPERWKNLPSIVLVKCSPYRRSLWSCSCCLDLEEAFIVRLRCMVRQHVTCQTNPSELAEGTRDIRRFVYASIGVHMNDFARNEHSW
jgi:hypothetical protein